MTVLDNSIEIPYRKLQDRLSDEYSPLYGAVPHQKLAVIFSTLHASLMDLFDKMNIRLPTGDDEAYYWADESRELIQDIDILNQLQRALAKTPLAFEIDEYYRNLFAKCSSFLCQSRGSQIPAHMDKIELYYTIPIFRMCDERVIVVTPEISAINREYITDISKRALEDVDAGNYDSAITKCRTLVEETFCYVIELKNEKPSDSGDIGKLYNQVKQLYNMHQDKNIDKRINSLLSGLEKILVAIAQMRNEGSDAHGVGQRRIRIAEYHARLFINSAMTMADFVLSVGQNHKNSMTN